MNIGYFVSPFFNLHNIELNIELSFLNSFFSFSFAPRLILFNIF